MHRTNLTSILVALTAAFAAAGASLFAGPVLAAQAPSHQGPASAESAFTVTAEVGSPQVITGRKVTVTGTVTPAVNGGTVILQKRFETGGPWKYAGTATMGRQGKFTLVDKPTSVVARSYRVVKKATKTRAQGVSAALPVTVYRWQDLTSLEKRNWYAMYDAESVTIDGTDFDDSIEGSTYEASGFLDYNLGRDCLKVKATFGITDDSDTTATGTINVLGDGATLFTGAYQLTQSQQATVPIAGVFRLAFTYTSTNSNGSEDQSGAVAAVATPQILCSF